MNTETVEIIPVWQQMDTSWLGSVCAAIPKVQFLNEVSVLAHRTSFRHSDPAPAPNTFLTYSPYLSQRQNILNKDTNTNTNNYINVRSKADK